MTQILREQELCLFTTVSSESRTAPDTEYVMSAQLTQAERMRDCISISRNTKDEQGRPNLLHKTPTYVQRPRC